MSAPTTPRAARLRDWATLRAEAQQRESRVSNEARALWLAGKGPDPSPGWDLDYIDAMQRALEGRDVRPLLAMLDAEVPLSRELLPALAEVLRDAHQGRSQGRARELTHADDAAIREHFDWMVRHLHTWRGDTRQKISDTVAIKRIAELRAVSTDTVRRSLARTKPE